MKWSINRWSIIYHNLWYSLKICQKTLKRHHEKEHSFKIDHLWGFHLLFQNIFLQSTIDWLLLSNKRHNKSSSVAKWCSLPEIITYCLKRLASCQLNFNNSVVKKLQREYCVWKVKIESHKKDNNIVVVNTTGNQKPMM